MSHENKPWVKVGYADNSLVSKISAEQFESLASKNVTDRLNKFAQTIKSVAPRSDDFLYFSIIFLKAAEASLIDGKGELKKIGNEKAWGYFDESWRWHGNVKPHKNNNGDIFPELELKKATRNWIGRPLCVDHKSESVDGVRGIILDTYYDEKLKQVVGLCALDKINYPDLARKVTTGVVRYGSMGTAVATSVCTECGKHASSPREYCNHIANRQAWGEINVGLKPIEYSLVVQPAEPGAILLRCFASINKHKAELESYGFNTEVMLESLDNNQANDLDILLNSVCGPEGCSLEQRQRIVKGYLNTNGFTKAASIKSANYDRQLLEDLARFEDVLGVKYSEEPEEYHKFFGDKLKGLMGGDDLSQPLGETLTSGQSASGAESLTSKDDGDVSDLTGTQSSGLIAGVSEPNPDSFSDEGDLIGRNVFTSDNNESIKLSSITEEIMNETKLRRRAALRRRLAHPQGGSAPAAEPAGTYKDEGAQQNKIREQDDKQMLQTKPMGGTDGMVPGDKEVKEKQLRAEEQLENQKKAYFHGANHPQPGPATFTTEDYHKYWDMDKQMHQTKPMGGDKGMFPGDEQIKAMHKRAKYEGPSLSTKFKQKRALDGSVNKEASCFEVYSGDNLVIAATAKDIFGTKLASNWDWITSQDYAKRVVSEIRENGIGFVGNQLTRTAQELPPMPGEEAALPAEPAEELGALPEELPMDEGMDSDDSQQVIEDSLVTMEDTIEKIRTSLVDLGGDDVNVDINVGEGADMDADKLALSKSVFDQLKTVLAEATDSADELALLRETYDRYSKFSSSQKTDLKELSGEALRDFSTIVGQSKALISMASTISSTLVKTSEFSEDTAPVAKAPVAPPKSPVTVDSDADKLVVDAMLLRKNRRQAMLKKAQEQFGKEDAESCADDETAEADADKESDAHDGIGMKENAPVAGVAKDTAEGIATKAPTGGDHKPAGHTGNQDAQQHSDYSGTPSRAVAESGTPSPNKEHAAADADMPEAKEHDAKDEDIADVAEEAAEEEVEEHEEDMHGKESDAKDKVDEATPVQAKLTESLMKRKAEEEREAYRVRLRRAYNVAMEMQRKGMLAPTRPALDRQVDNMMEFDDKSFESFKRSIANTKSTANVKTASEVTGLNVGTTEEPNQTHSSKKVDAETLSSMWD